MKRVGVIAVCDYISQPNGGEVILLNNFLAVDSCKSIEYSLIGMTFDKKMEVGAWTTIDIRGKKYRFLPVTKVLKDKEKTHIPFRLRVVLGLYKYMHIISEARFDDIYLHSAELGIPFWNSNIPLVYHVHGDPSQTLKYSRFSAFRGSKWTAYYTRIIEKTMKKSRRIVWAANRSKQLFLEYDPGLKNDVESKSCVIHSSFDTSLIIPTNYQFDLSNNSHLVTVGRLAKIKRIDFLIRVTKKLIDQGIDVDFLICGDGEEKDNLQKLANELNIEHQVIFLGLLNRTQLAEILSRSQVFLFASENEAMSLVVLESLYLGTPVVSTNVGDVPDVVKNGSTGYIIEGYDTDEFVDKILCVIKDKKDKFEEECKNQSMNYTPEKMAKRIDKVFLDE